MSSKRRLWKFLHGPSGPNPVAAAMHFTSAAFYTQAARCGPGSDLAAYATVKAMEQTALGMVESVGSGERIRIGKKHTWKQAPVEHYTDGRPCWCQPTIEDDFEGVRIIIHKVAGEWS